MEEIIALSIYYTELITEHDLYPPVKTKRDMVRRYQAGEFGNHSPSWDSYLDWAKEHLGTDKFELFHIRNRIAGGPTWYNVAKYLMADTWAAALRKSPSNLLYISSMAPTHLLNGELMRTHEGLVLFYSAVQKPMRDSLKEGGREAKGLTAKLILQYYMNQRSYDWTMLLLDRYPDHVIEFTVVDRCWGTVPGFNALWWEIRRDY